MESNLSSGDKLDEDRGYLKLKVEELERLLIIRDKRIGSLQKELSTLNDALASQVNKNQQACEARDECKFKINELESSMSALKLDNDTLRQQMNERNSSKTLEMHQLEILVCSYADHIKTCESKIEQLELKHKFNDSNTESDVNINQWANDLNKFRKGNEELKAELKQEKENTEKEQCRSQKLEEYIELLSQEKKVLESTIKECESKLEGRLQETDDLKFNLETYKHMLIKLKEDLQVEQNTNKLLKEREGMVSSLEIKLKDLRDELAETLQTEQDPFKRKLTEVLLDCENILVMSRADFCEQLRIMQTKFEDQTIAIKQRLLYAQTLVTVKSQRNVLKEPTSTKPQERNFELNTKAEESLSKPAKENVLKEHTKSQVKMKQKTVESETEREVCVLKECSAIMTQNKRQTRVEKSVPQKKTKAEVANAVAQKKTSKKNKKLQNNENVYSNLEKTSNEDTPVTASDISVGPEIASKEQSKGGRQLRQRKKE